MRWRGGRQDGRDNGGRPADPIHDDAPTIDLRTPAPPAESMLDHLDGFGPTSAEDDARRYSAWAGRLHDKSVRDHATIVGSPTEPSPAMGYWSSDSVLSGSDLLFDPGAATDQIRKARLLLEFGLAPDATRAEISAAYRALAKDHHPDRWVEADEDSRAHHAERILHINAVHEVLRRDFRG